MFFTNISHTYYFFKFLIFHNFWVTLTDFQSVTVI